jgi:hypothetical protein
MNIDKKLVLKVGAVGYNAGFGYAPIAIGCGSDPDVITHNGKYVATALGEARRLLELMGATGVS